MSFELVVSLLARTLAWLCSGWWVGGLLEGRLVRGGDAGNVSFGCGSVGRGGIGGMYVFRCLSVWVVSNVREVETMKVDVPLVDPFLDLASKFAHLFLASGFFCINREDCFSNEFVCYFICYRQTVPDSLVDGRGILRRHSVCLYCERMRVRVEQMKSKSRETLSARFGEA
jgi:hypothetical protein